MTVTRIDPMSFAKVSALLYAVGGLVAGLFTLVFSTAAGLMTETAQSKGFLALGAGSIIVFPLLYGLIGFALSWALAGLFNFIAKHVGGIKIEVS